MTAYVVTAVHNRYTITKRFIENLKSQTYTDIHLVLVDDGCTDGTSQMVQEEYPNSTILHGDGNLWWGGALHLAYKDLLARKLDDNDVVFLVNDDSRWQPDYVEKAINILQKNTNCLLTGCAYGVATKRYLDGPVEFDLKNGAVRLLEPGAKSNCASTRSLCLLYSVLKKVGGFHPVLLPHYASDYEYTIRAAKKGYPIISEESLRYEFSEDTTGDNSHKNITLKKVFSKRSKLNPFYKLSFILLIAPIYRLPNYIMYQIKHFKKHNRDSGEVL